MCFDFSPSIFASMSVYQRPDEKPPGGTRARPPDWSDWLAEAGAADGWPAALGASEAAAWADSGCAELPFRFGSIVPITPFMLEEFCWLYFGRGGLAFTSGEPKMSEWPPPGGFSTRLELFSSERPMLYSVEPILSKVTLTSPFFNKQKMRSPNNNSSRPHLLPQWFFTQIFTRFFSKHGCFDLIFYR